MSDRPWFGNWFLAILGAAVIGVSLPAVLVSADCGSQSVFLVFADFERQPELWKMSLKDRVLETVRFIISGIIVCGPLTLLLGSILFSYLRAQAQSGASMTEIIRSSLWLGVFLSMFNVPAWVVVKLIPASGGELILKTLLLFGVAGSSAGAWIAWQAWRTEFPGTAWLPPFSLKALMLVVLSWGGLLAVFTGW